MARNGHFAVVFAKMVSMKVMFQILLNIEMKCKKM